MGNVYGVDAETPLVQHFTALADVTLTAGTETTVLTTTTAFAATTPGSYYPVIRGMFANLCGGTAPTALTLAARIHSGSDFVSQVVPPASLVVSVYQLIWFELIGPESTLWYPGGQILELTGLAATTASTWKFSGSYMNLELKRGLNTLP